MHKANSISHKHAKTVQKYFSMILNRMSSYSNKVFQTTQFIFKGGYISHQVL